MNHIMISVSEVTAYRLLQKAQEQQVSVAVFLEQLSLTLVKPQPQEAGHMSEETQTIEERRSRMGSVRSSPWLDKAMERAIALPSGTEFSLGTLLRENWGDLPEQRVLGKVFRRRVEETGVARRDGDLEEPGMARMAKYVRL